MGNFHKVQDDSLDSLADDNKKLSDENKALKKTHRNVDEKISQVVGNARAKEVQKRSQLSTQVSDLSAQVVISL